MNYLDFFRVVSSGNFEKVKELYNDKIPLNHNISYACGATWIIPLPLVTAFQRGYYDIARFLIAKGADLDAVCQKNHKTARDFMPENFLLEQEKEQKDVIKDFLWKVRDGKLEEVREYLEEYPGTLLNENLVIHDRIYALPLAIAFKKNRREVAKFLIGRGADMEAYCSKEGVYVKELKPKDF